MSEYQHQSFSVRNGIKQSKDIQLESMDDDLRNRLWSAFDRCFPSDKFDGTSYPLHEMYKDIWTDSLKHPVDEYNRYRDNESYNEIRTIFQRGLWNELFDLIEFVIRYGFPESDDFIEQCQWRFDRRELRIQNCGGICCANYIAERNSIRRSRNDDTLCELQMSI